MAQKMPVSRQDNAVAQKANLILGYINSMTREAIMLLH